MPCTILRLHFNSIKVRLKQENTTINPFFLNLFQFHKGTIKTNKEMEEIASRINFNSIKVRLKH